MLIEFIAAGSILLTFVGTYRFSSYFFGGKTAMSLLIASMMSSIYFVLYPFLTLIIGFLVIVSPVAYLIAKTGGLSIDLSNIRDFADNDRNCTNCGAELNSDYDYCQKCGKRIDETKIFGG
jgi:hypothetical protein